MAQRIHVWEHLSVNSSDSTRLNCKICNKSIAQWKAGHCINML